MKPLNELIFQSVYVRALRGWLDVSHRLHWYLPGSMAESQLVVSDVLKFVRFEELPDEKPGSVAALLAPKLHAIQESLSTTRACVERISELALDYEVMGNAAIGLLHVLDRSFSNAGYYLERGVIVQRHGLFGAAPISSLWLIPFIEALKRDPEGTRQMVLDELEARRIQFWKSL